MVVDWDHNVLDDIAFSVRKGNRNTLENLQFETVELSPVIEYMKIIERYQAPDLNGFLFGKTGSDSELLEVLQRKGRTWYSAYGPKIGFYRVSLNDKESSTEFMRFCVAGQKAAQDSGFDVSVSRKLVAAMSELHSNVIEHAYFYDGAIVAWRADALGFEFCVSDFGVGVLASLRQGNAYKDLEDEGQALQLAVKEGVSRRGVGVGSGYGFCPIFVGLANLRGNLRFRSGDHGLVIEGGCPGVVTARLKQKVPISGFHASVRCFSGKS